jgi:hypothetical protein
MARAGFTISDLNRLNRDFWERERIYAESRMADATILKTGLELLNLDSQRGVPLCWQKPFEMALAEGERLKRLVMSQEGKKAGEAKKTDALQQVIVDVVRVRPDITSPQLRDYLRERCNTPPLEGIDGDAILFAGHGGRTGGAPISGLKDRLTRAKKSLRSR